MCALNGSKLGFDPKTRTMWHRSAPDRILHIELSSPMKQPAVSREEAAGLDSKSWLYQQMHHCYVSQIVEAAENKSKTPKMRVFKGVVRARSSTHGLESKS
jgi:hypothetical protein